MPNKAVFLGRFQPLHLGHYRVIENQRENFRKFSVAVGSAGKSREQENPLSFEERKEIIHACFPNLEVMALEDTVKTEEGNKQWAEQLEENVEAGVVITGNELVKRLVRDYTGKELMEQELYDPDIYSGTEIRRRIRSGEEWRYLVPDCSEDKLDCKLELIRESGIEYDYDPGWKRENARHGTSGNNL